MTEENVQTMSKEQVTPLGTEFDLFAAMEFAIPDIVSLRGKVHINPEERSRFVRQVEELPEPASTESKEKILRRGLGHWTLGQYEPAAECLKQIKDQPVASYFLARSFLAKGKTQEAKGLFENLLKGDKSNNYFQTGLLQCFEAFEDWEALKKGLKSSAKGYQETGDFRYFQGRIAESESRSLAAMEAFEQALESDPNHRGSLFRLAYQLDLRGMDQEAISLYERLMHLSPPDAPAVMNLGVLYEDHGQYEKAAACFEAVLKTHPTHSRARLFLKDARASMNMFYDEDQEKKEDKLQQILRIPITDFELSVRARNCLAKMEINTLGDLVKKTETELLSFKNFGETSLVEIKEILRSKGIVLGMTKDQGMQEVTKKSLGSLPEISPEVSQKPLSEIDFSVRSRRVVDALGIRTLGELASKTEKELLSTPNFGQTSLNEVKEKLRNFGLNLVGSES